MTTKLKINELYGTLEVLTSMRANEFENVEAMIDEFLQETNELLESKTKEQCKEILLCFDLKSNRTYLDRTMKVMSKQKWSKETKGENMKVLCSFLKYNKISCGHLEEEMYIKKIWK